MLTDAACRSSVAKDKPYKLADARGLFLFVAKSGFRSWRWKYRWRGKERQLVLGAYPDMALSKARNARDDAARLLRDGIDPSAEKKRGAPIGALTLQQLAERWHEVQKVRWAPKHADDVLNSLKADVFPAIGGEAVTDLKPARLLEVLRKVETRGAIETAHRLCQRLDAMLTFGIASALCEDNPAAAIRGALVPVRKRRQPALRSIEDGRALLRAVEAEPGQPLVKIASRLLALTAVRPGVIRHARPAELEGLDGDSPIWRIPAAKMKLSQDRKDDAAFEFVVPLSVQAVELFKLAIKLTRPGPYLFPSTRDAHRPMSDATIGAMYKRQPTFGGRHVPHGWRSTFSTVMNERAERENRPGDRAVIDLMLAHVPSGVEGAYNRAAYMPRRRELAQAWADLLTTDLPAAATLLDGPRR